MKLRFTSRAKETNFILCFKIFFILILIKVFFFGFKIFNISKIPNHYLIIKSSCIKIDSDVLAKRLLNIFKIEYDPKKPARLMVSDLLFSLTSIRNEFCFILIYYVLEDKKNKDS